ncbi:MAG TPA: penicillin-binding protein 2 [Candidatus Xenobia bacterium]|jgi:stage V sporulation protein D (sporulation-specific penicillin-binding protein)
MTTKWNPNIKTRLIVLFYLMLACYAGLAVRLVRVQALDQVRPLEKGVSLKERGKDEHIGSMSVPALRGSIMDCDGQLLATSIGLPSVAANPAQVADPSSTAYALADVLSMPPDRAYRLLSTPGTFVWMKRKVSLAVADKVEKMKLPGVFLLHESTGRRFYPKGALGSHLIGYTGMDDNGLEGLEAVFDNQLKGKDGTLEAEMDRDGTMIPGGWSKITPARPGNSLVLTIDETLQYLCEREIEKAVKKHSAESGSIVVMDIKTGDILAMANYPTYDHRHYSKAPPADKRNRAVTDEYEPGSTFKVFLAAGALDSGKVNETQVFSAGGTINVQGWTLHNAEAGEGAEGGMAALPEIIQESYNTGAASIALYIGKKTFHHYLRRFGFGDPTGICLPGESPGDIPPLKLWEQINTATIAYGQGATATPLQLVRAMGAIANHGKMMKPRLVKEMLGPDGHAVKIFPPQAVGHPIREETAERMVKILRQVVTKGTGTNAEVRGYPVCGKTGTASVEHNGSYSGRHYIGSFLGFLPMQNPKIALIVKIQEPQDAIYGGAVAAPVFHIIGRDAMRHFGIAPVPMPEKPDKKNPTAEPSLDPDEDPTDNSTPVALPSAKPSASPKASASTQKSRR